MSDRIANRSASAARITGDDLQFLVAWYWLLASRRQSDIALVEIEALAAGNLDDVVIRRRRGADIYCQVKATVSGRDPLTLDWMMMPSASKGPSVIKKFFDFWGERGGAGQTDLRFITNRSIDSRDPLLAERDVAARIGDAIRRTRRSAALGRAVQRLVDHLETDEATLISFLDDLRIETDATATNWADRVADVARPDIAHDRTAILIGVGQVREWVKRTRPRLSAANVLSAARSHGLVLALPRAVVAVSAIDAVVTDDALVAADFIPEYRGDEPSRRRGLTDPTDWNQTLGPAIDRLAAECRDEGVDALLVRAACRLPMWFRIGWAFAETAGFSVATVHHGEVWESAAPIAEPELELEWTTAPDEDEAAVFVSMVADDPAADGQRFMESINFEGGIATLRRRTALTPIDAQEGASYALAIRNEIREVTRLHQIDRLHVFLATPAPVALLLGHLWDRMPLTQLYEDLGKPGAYEPAFEIGGRPPHPPSKPAAVT